MKVIVIWDNHCRRNRGIFANMELAKKSVFSKYKDSGKTFSISKERQDGSVWVEIGSGLSGETLTLQPMTVIEVIDTDF